MTATGLTYCGFWNDLLRQPIDVLTAEQARTRNQTSEAYAVVLGDPVAPDAVIEVNWSNSYLGVWYFNEDGRRDEVCGMRLTSSKRLFLNEVTIWVYPPGAGEDFSDAVCIESVQYEPTGDARESITDVGANETERPPTATCLSTSIGTTFRSSATGRLSMSLCQTV